MICKYCNAVFRRENLIYCPYCDMEIVEEDISKTENTVNVENKEDKPPELLENEWDLNKLTEIRVLTKLSSLEEHGAVKITIKGNKNLLSPATGTNYVMVFDEEAYQVRLTKGDQDISESLELPVGKHEGVLRCYSWNDQGLKHPEINANSMITIDVKKNMTTEIIIKTGTVLSPQKIEIFMSKDK